MSLNLDDLKYFLTISETLNLTRASEKLGITQPTLSYAIKRLENELGGELLIRLKNGVQLSQLGIEFETQARKVIFEWEQACAIVTSQKNEISGKFKIGVHPSVALYSFEHFIPHLTKKYPSLEFDFEHGLSREMTEKVVSWNLDFGLVINPKPNPDLVIKEICKDEVSFYGTKNHKDCLIIEPNLNQTQSLLKKVRKSNQSKIMTSPNLEVIAKLASLGEGMAILPGRVAKKYKGLKKIENTPVFNDKLCLIYRVEKQKSRASREIISSILSCRI